MHDHLHAMIPLERYRAILGELASERDSWVDTFWLRFAAQAAVLHPEQPTLLAGRIRRIAEALHQHAKWYQDLASPMRFVVAAMLVQHHIPIRDFLAEQNRSAELLREVGLRRGGFYETMALLILRISPGNQPFTMLAAERLKAIYDQLKRCHWWLTSSDDLPACAALAQCHGSAELVVARAEDAYQQLHGAGLATGDHLRTAANLLPLAGLDIDATVARYRGISERLAAVPGGLPTEHYDGVAVLTLLPHRAELVAERVQAVRGELDLLQPELAGPCNFLIAVDLAFLDLMRLDDAQAAIRDAAGMAAMLRTLHAFHIASAVLVSQIDGELALSASGIDGMGWPYSYL